MNRDIAFRGKTLYGHWVYGSLIIDAFGNHQIVTHKLGPKGKSQVTDHYEVNPSTVGQYVGKIGANSCEVWEGDKVIARLNHHGKPTKLEIPAFISYNEHVGTWQIRYENHAGQLVSDDIGFRYFLEVVVTIHDTHLTKQS